MPRLLVALLASLGLLVGACSGTDSSRPQWRDLTVAVPDGWVVAEQETTVLSLANATIEDVGQRGERLVFVQFTHEPGATPGEWRDFVEQEGGDLEVDEAIFVDEVPATRLVFSFVTNGIPTREMVVVIPARGIVALFQPVNEQGETDGPERFLANRDVFDQILASIDFGAPVS